MCTCEQHTYTSSEHFHLPGATKIFVPQARIELATFQIPSFPGNKQEDRGENFKLRTRVRYENCGEFGICFFFLL